MTESTEVLVHEVMSMRVVTIKTTQTLSDALDRFRLTGLRHLVVTDETGACAGVVSDRTVSAIWPGVAISGLERRVGRSFIRAAPWSGPMTPSMSLLAGSWTQASTPCRWLMGATRSSAS